jgi:hypothetical protein
MRSTLSREWVAAQYPDPADTDTEVIGNELADGAGGTDSTLTRLERRTPNFAVFQPLARWVPGSRSGLAVTRLGVRLPRRAF